MGAFIFPPSALSPSPSDPMHCYLKMGTEEKGFSTGDIEQFAASRLKGRRPVEGSEGQRVWEVTLSFI